MRGYEGQGLSDANKCKVIYESEGGGLLTYDGQRIIFQHRQGEQVLEPGLGEVVEGTYRDMGTYGFAYFKNVYAVEPVEYRKLRFYSWRGVPLKISKGMYGGSVFFKEEYERGTYIRAYNEEGTAIMFERDKVIKERYRGENKYFTRLDELIEVWEDITEDIREKLIEEMLGMETEVSLDNEDLQISLQNIYQNGVYRLSNGVIVGSGKYESIIYWSTPMGFLETVWLGHLIDLEELGVGYEDITEEIAQKVKELRGEIGE